jgi:hypothetical protein
MTASTSARIETEVRRCSAATLALSDRDEGRASDALGKFPTFAFGSAMSIVMVLIYTHLGQVSLTVAILVNIMMFVGIFSRMVLSQALISAIPEPAQSGKGDIYGATAEPPNCTPEHAAAFS